jgi:hypothetical protein
VRFQVMPPRWWSGTGNKTGGTFFNKRNLLWYGGLSLLLFSPLFGHGGAERGEWRAIICRCGGVGGESSTSELIHADGSSTDAILCRQGGVSSTSIAEAIRASRRSSTAPLHQVVHPRRVGDGHRLTLFVGREPLSILLLFLGGIAWRTPATGGSDAQGPDCLGSFSYRVFYVKSRAFFLRK